MVFGDEGCLSVPEVYDKVPRHARGHGARARSRRRDARVRGRGPARRSASSTRWITCIGKVFVEYLSPLKRNRIKTKMLKKIA